MTPIDLMRNELVNTVKDLEPLHNEVHFIMAVSQCYIALAAYIRAWDELNRLSKIYHDER